MKIKEIESLQHELRGLIYMQSDDSTDEYINGKIDILKTILKNFVGLRTVVTSSESQYGLGTIVDVHFLTLAEYRSSKC